MARENKFLTQEVARLNAELRQKDNRLAQLDAQGSGGGGVGGSNHTGGAEYSSLGSATALRIERVHRKQLERAAMLRAKEKELRAKALTIRKELVTVTSYCKELEDHVENLQLEVQVRAFAVVRGRCGVRRHLPHRVLTCPLVLLLLLPPRLPVPLRCACAGALVLCALQSRPTMRDWREAQRSIKTLERQVQAAVDAGIPPQVLRNRASDAATEQAARNGMADTRSLIAKDKAAWKLRLYRLDTYSRDQLLAVVKDVCVELEIGDTDMLPVALRKMKRVIGIVPMLEAFYKRVCNFVLVHDSGAADASGGGEGTPGRVGDRILPTLQRWAKDLKTLESHREFHKTVQRQLLKRSELGSAPPATKLTRQEVGGGSWVVGAASVGNAVTCGCVCVRVCVCLCLWRRLGRR